jgi:uncharacterized DUF497 family protein
MILTWDKAKRDANLAKHGLDFASLDAGFFARAVIGPVRAPRSFAVGTMPSGEIVTVIWAPLGTEAVAIISMRRSNRKERSFLDGS